MTCEWPLEESFITRPAMVVLVHSVALTQHMLLDPAALDAWTKFGMFVPVVFARGCVIRSEPVCCGDNHPSESVSKDMLQPGVPCN